MCTLGIATNQLHSPHQLWAWPGASHNRRRVWEMDGEEMMLIALPKVPTLTTPWDSARPVFGSAYHRRSSYRVRTQFPTSMLMLII
jgi:hypothetical protein